MGAGQSVLEEMNRVCEIVGRNDKSPELTNALEALSNRIKANPVKNIAAIINEPGTRVRSIISNAIIDKQFRISLYFPL